MQVLVKIRFLNVSSFHYHTMGMVPTKEIIMNLTAQRCLWSLLFQYEKKSFKQSHSNLFQQTLQIMFKMYIKVFSLTVQAYVQHQIIVKMYIKVFSLTAQAYVQHQIIFKTYIKVFSLIVQAYVQHQKFKLTYSKKNLSRNSSSGNQAYVQKEE